MKRAGKAAVTELPYKAFALGADGSRVPIEGNAIVIEVAPDIDIEIDLAPHPRFSGHLVLHTPAVSRMARTQRAGKLDDFAVVFGASNVLHVVVERRLRSPKRAAKRRSGR